MHPKHQHLTPDQWRVKLWGRVARFGRFLGWPECPELLLREERRMVFDMGVMVPAEAMLAELRELPAFRAFERAERRRARGRG